MHTYADTDNIHDYFHTIKILLKQNHSGIRDWTDDYFQILLSQNHSDSTVLMISFKNQQQLFENYQKWLHRGQVFRTFWDIYLSV